MPFKPITSGKNAGKFKSPSGRVFTKAQVSRYYANGGSFTKKSSGGSHSSKYGKKR